jgi:hypothetical protein
MSAGSTSGKAREKSRKARWTIAPRMAASGALAELSRFRRARRPIRRVGDPALDACDAQLLALGFTAFGSGA